MRVLFITNTARYNFAEPLGMMLLSQQLLNAGHETRFAPDDYAVSSEIVASWKPDVVATTVTTGEHTGLFQLNRELKEVRPFLSVMGGPHCTFYPNMINEPGVDVMCRGEGEGPMLDLITAYAEGEDYRNIPNLSVKDEKGEVRANPVRPLIQDLDSIPFADRGGYYAIQNRPATQGVVYFMASRGCVFNCAYCFNRQYFEIYKNNGRRFRCRSPENLVEEAERVIGTWGGDYVVFVDDIFPVKPRWLDRFRELYRERVGVPFTCNTRIELIQPDRCRMLKDAGCNSVIVGLESGNEELRKTILDRHMTNDDVREKTQMLHDAGLKFLTTNIIGFPNETVESALETLRLNQQIRPAQVGAMFFQPYPGTEAGEMARRLGMFDGNPDGCGDTMANVGKNYKIQDGEKLHRLRALLGVATEFRFLTPLVPYLIRLPLGTVYNWISRLWVVYCFGMRTHPTKFRPRRYAKALKVYLTGRGGPY